MKKLILLGAISPFCDLVKEFEALKIEPYVCDYYSDAPAKRMGHPAFDISTTDVKAILKLAQSVSANGCVSAFSDRNILPCIEVCDKLGSNYFFDVKTVECFTDKQKMKAFFNDIEVPVIKYALIKSDEINDKLSDFTFPVVIKPVDAYGSKGVFVCNSIDEVKMSFSNAVKESKDYSDTIIVEEYYKADEISITAWVKQGRAYITCIYDVTRNINGDISLAAVSFPSKYTTELFNELDKLLNFIIKKSNIREGPITLQCFVGEKGIKVSELLCRLAGGSPYLYPTYIGGANIAKMLLQHAADMKIDYQNLESFKPFPKGNEVYYDVQFLINKKCKIHYNMNLEEFKSSFNEIVDFRIYYKNGAELINVPKSGIIFARAICKTTRDASYFELIERLESSFSVFDGNNQKVSFIRKPENVEFNKKIVF